MCVSSVPHSCTLKFCVYGISDLDLDLDIDDCPDCQVVNYEVGNCDECLVSESESLLVSGFLCF